MAYNPNTPPRRIRDLGMSNGQGEYIYESTDAHGTVEGANYISDGSKLGMKVGDIVMAVKTDTGGITWHRVQSMAAANAAMPWLPRAVTLSAAIFS